MDEIPINSIGSSMDKYAAVWPVQWLKGTIFLKHLQSMTGYTQALK